jgi:hypothetical protein
MLSAAAPVSDPGSFGSMTPSCPFRSRDGQLRNGTHLSSCTQGPMTYMEGTSGATADGGKWSGVAHTATTMAVRGYLRVPQSRAGFGSQSRWVQSVPPARDLCTLPVRE